MSNEFIMIQGARVSFPHLFTPPVLNGEEGKCGAQLLLYPDKHKAVIDRITANFRELERAKFKGGKLPPEKYCMRAGEDKGRPEMAGYLVVSANSKTAPHVISHLDGRTIITNERDSRIYAGCHVNAKIRLWAQDNSYGRRINAELVAIQFAGEGESLDGSYVPPEEAVAGFGATQSADDADFLG